MPHTITIAKNEIPLHESPKHKAVMQVQDIMTNWLLDKIDMSTLDQDVPIEVAISQAMKQNPKLATDILPMQRTLPLDQTIMLATNMGYNQLTEMADGLSEAEYLQLYEAAKKAIGGTAEDFFIVYATGTTGKARLMNQESLDKIPDKEQSL